MRKIRIITKLTLILLLATFVTSCTGFLNRPPKDTVTKDTYFQTGSQLESATNDLYDLLPGDEVYINDSRSDNTTESSEDARVKGTRITPVNKGSGGWSWSGLRRINFVIQNAKRVKDTDARKKYTGIARFFRAHFYFDKVKRFGAVPWYSEVLNVKDSSLYKPRDSRSLVMDSVLADINYAIKNIPAEKKLYEITKYTALGLKSRICLFEGTFRKYHDLGSDYKGLLKEAAKAARKLIDSGAYTLYTNGGPNKAYRDLFARHNQDMTETILAVNYDQSLRTHDLAYRMTQPTLGDWGFNKTLINSYLMADGSRFTDQPGYDKMTFLQEMQNRDPRLYQTTPGPHYHEYKSDEPADVDLSFAKTGYRVIKALSAHTGGQWGSGGSYNDVILMRYAEILLNYAEAKAELGTLTQHDIDISINKLRDRVGMPHLNMAQANAHPDPYQENLYPNVSGPNEGVILEIRRERRVELVQEGFRWDDLMRWKAGKILEQPILGMYFPHLGAYDFTGDGKPDVYVYKGDDSGKPASVTTEINVEQRPLTHGTSGNIIAYPGGKFEAPKDYYYPIPLQDLTLNPNLKQNPGWETP
jgi:hypothetical protein